LRIAFFIRSLDKGGAEQQLVTIARALAERGHTVSVMVFYPGGALESELPPAGVRLISLDKRGRFDVASFVGRALRIIRKERPDVLHGYLSAANILVVSLRHWVRTPVVVGLRSSYVDLGRYGWFVGGSYRLERLAARFADLVIVNSSAGFDHALAAGLSRERLQMIPNGIDTHRFNRDADGRARVRREWAVSPAECLVGVVGRLDPMKDHPTFLRAAAEAASRHPELRFVCVGDGLPAYRTELRALGESLGLGPRLVWAGERSDMPAVYNALDVACSSSYGEGFSNAVGEAMASGVPCVVTDVGDSASIVGDTGVVVPPRDASALARGFESSAEHLSGVGDRVRKRIEDQFSVSRLAERTERALEGLVRRK
jgi:glycosyltransferase involved in cell wall biosynthesis